MSEEIKGIITNIQRFSVHDGPGVRTTVFFKGCPLRCIWCHNPETHLMKPQPQLINLKCTGCGVCVEICPSGCHKIEIDTEKNTFRHLFDSDNCIYCYKCIGACKFGALDHYGYYVTVDEVIEEVLKDKVFYGKKGGITLSGGEPMVQAEFANALLKSSKDNHLSTCIETCGFGTKELDTELCDHIYYDIKTVDQKLHKELTGSDNSMIIRNLKMIAEKASEKIIVRTVIVKGLTDNEKQIYDIIDLIRPLGIKRFDLLAFHPYGSSKADAIGLKRKFMGAEFVPDDDVLCKLKESINFEETQKVRQENH